MKLVFLLSFLCATITMSWGQDTINFKGNVLVRSKPESISILDPVSGNTIKETNPGKFTLLNGEKIYSKFELDFPPAVEDSVRSNIKLSEYLFQIVKSKLEMLGDGMYVLDIVNPVIDKDGRLVYYEMKGIKQIIIPAELSKNQPELSKGQKKKLVYNPLVTDDRTIPFDTKNEINDVVNKALMQFPILKAGRKANIPVNTTGNFFSLVHYILVEKNVAKNIDDDFFSL